MLPKVHAVALPSERIERRIYLIRGHKVMLDRDLAELYRVPTGALNRAVKRNSNKFPIDFMFKLTQKEARFLRCQFGILEHGQHDKYLPNAFTEQGVAMLSGLLNSACAIAVNIAIMRAFVRLREIMSTHKDLSHKIDDLQRHVEGHDGAIQNLFDIIEEMREPPPERPRRIGFRTD